MSKIKHLCHKNSKQMRNQIMIKCLCCLLSLSFVCLLLAGCGGEGGGSGASPAGTQESTADTPGGRTVLTAVVTGPGRDTLERIRAYNESSSLYFIEVKEYETDMAGSGTDSLETQLTLDILSGKGPDLVIWDSAGYSPSIASGRLMENLYDFMEKDEDFRKEDYYENILRAFEMNGELYTLPSDFAVETVCGKAEEIGSDRDVTEGWEMGEMTEAFEKSPHGEWLTVNHSRELTFLTLCYGCIGNFVDWETGECRFDTPEFVELLELSDRLPDHLMLEPDFSYYEALRSGKAFWEPVILTSPWKVADWRISFGNVDMRWPGYPVAEGEKDLGGGVAKPYGECFSICQNSSGQEAAWEFIKTYLTEEAQRETGGIPLLRSVSEERIQNALTAEFETVEGVEQEVIRHKVTAEGEEEVGLSCITEQDAEIYRSIIENTHRSYGSDFGMMEIIREEAEVYFEKDRDAASVAAIIQNRVSIYVSERIS